MSQWLASVIDPYYQQVLMLVGIFIIAALGLNLITGLCGQLTFGHAAFLSIGAYTAAILTRDYHVPFLASLILGGLMAAIFGILLGIPVLKLTGDYLGIATLGFGEIVRVAFTNMKITGGAIGLAAIPRASNLVNVTVFVILAVVAVVLLENSRFGRALKAIREDEIAAEAMGVNTMWYKIQAFGIGCFLAGISGGFYAHMLQYLNPNDFGFLKSFEILNFVVLGGLGSIPGTIVGTTVLTLAPEFLRFVQEYRMMIYGLLLVLMMIFRPNGLLGGVNFRRLLRRRKQKAAALSS
ncbi:branched-chain amino acid ABC transporter permease [Desulfofundulus thermosubterraneus]|nr:branched-chain amino acid ABC transporter permease [Desulfofundulus thermosubterraneus]